MRYLDAAADVPTTFDVLTLVIAIIGALTGVLALSWQITTRTRGTHRVEVTATAGAHTLSNQGRMIGRLLAVEARNVGTAPVSITDWVLQTPEGDRFEGFFRDGDIDYPELPYVLDPGTNVKFYLRSDGVEAHLAAVDQTKLRGVVTLATGETVKSRRITLDR